MCLPKRSLQYIFPCTEVWKIDCLLTSEWSRFTTFITLQGSCHGNQQPKKTPSNDRFTSFFPATEDFHHQGNCGYRWGKQEQFSGAVCHHHQCEEPASTVGERQLQRGHTRKHCPGHTHRGTLGWEYGRWHTWEADIVVFLTHIRSIYLTHNNRQVISMCMTFTNAEPVLA